MKVVKLRGFYTVNKSQSLVPQDQPSHNSDRHPKSLDSAKLVSFPLSNFKEQDEML